MKREDEMMKHLINIYNFLEWSERNATGLFILSFVCLFVVWSLGLIFLMGTGKLITGFVVAIIPAILGWSLAYAKYREKGL